MTESLKSQITEVAEEFLQGVTLNQVQELRNPPIEHCLKALMATVNAHAAAVWIKEEDLEGQEMLTIAYNVGDKGSEVEGVVHQSLDVGLVSKAYREDELICHQGIFQHPEKTTRIDRELGQVTVHQIAGPFHMFGKRIGAMTAIQTLATGIAQHTTEWGFDETDCEQFSSWTRVIENLFEYAVLKQKIS